MLDPAPLERLISVPLTPEDVDNKRFATARVMRQGYDMTEVDNFLDEVAAEMKRLHDEIAELRSQASSSTEATGDDTTVAQASGSSTPTATDDPASDATASDASGSDAKADAGTTGDGESGEQASEGKHSEDGSADAAATSDVAADESAAATGTHAAEDELAEGETEVARVSGNRGELLRVATTEDAAAAAARMLELAGRNAEELVTDARSQADRIVAEASGRAEELDGETEQRRTALVAELERDHQELKDEVEDLRVFEREYRAQLRNYFQQQLEALDAQGGGVTLAEDLHEDEGEIGSRLRSILAEEESSESEPRGLGPPAESSAEPAAPATSEPSASSESSGASESSPSTESSPEEPRPGS